MAPYREEIRYEMFLQFIFYRQWNRIRAYAGENGILLMNPGALMDGCYGELLIDGRRLVPKLYNFKDE